MSRSFLFDSVVLMNPVQLGNGLGAVELASKKYLQTYEALRLKFWSILYV